MPVAEERRSFLEEFGGLHNALMGPAPSTLQAMRETIRHITQGPVSEEFVEIMREQTRDIEQARTDSAAHAPHP